MRHDQALVVQEAAADQTVVRRWIDPDDQIIAVLHGIDPPIFCYDLQLNFGIGKRKASTDSPERDMRDDDGGANSQSTPWDGGAEHYRLARFRDFRKWPGSAFLQRPAFLRQSQTMGPAFDQPDTKASLKFRDPARQRGLGTA